MKIQANKGSAQSVNIQLKKISSLGFQMHDTEESSSLSFLPAA